MANADDERVVARATEIVARCAKTVPPVPIDDLINEFVVFAEDDYTMFTRRCL